MLTFVKSGKLVTFIYFLWTTDYLPKYYPLENCNVNINYKTQAKLECFKPNLKLLV